MSEHTPGPWTMFEYREGGYFAISGPKHEDIAEVNPNDGADVGHPSEANARLIAAAPDLYEALRNVNKLITEASLTGFNCHDGDWATRLFESQQDTSNALRKARPASAPSTEDR